MARLIVKSPYIKCGAGQSAGGYLKYIATRERVEIIPDDRPPTNKQTQLIAKLVKDFPDAKELMEYEDYLSHPTKATASALITLTLEENWDKVQSMEPEPPYCSCTARSAASASTAESARPSACGAIFISPSASTRRSCLGRSARKFICHTAWTAAAGSMSLPMSRPICGAEITCGSRSAFCC